ncbi:MAG: hypothetical protein ACLFS3_00545 [Candidatus Aenigmatarchaeota archaeon]
MSLIKWVAKWVLVSIVLIGITMLLFGEAITPTKIIGMLIGILTGA